MVDGVGGNGEHGGLREVRACDGYTWAAGGNHAGQTEGGRGMDAHCFLDNGVEVGEVFDLGKGRHLVWVHDRGVEFLLELRDYVRILEAVVEQRAGGVGRGVAACDELGEGFGGEFLAAELCAGFVAAFHEAGEEVDAVRGVVEALVYTRDGDAGEVFDGRDALREEGVREVFGVGLELGEAAEGSEVERSVIGNEYRG